MDRNNDEARFDQCIDDEARWTLDGNRQLQRGGRSATQASNQFTQACRVMGDVEAIAHRAARIEDAHGVLARGPVESCKAVSHGQPPSSWSKTCSAASPCGSLIDRR